MQYTNLGRTGLKVSRLCLGTMNFGAADHRGRQPRDHGSGAGARHQFFDTANVYGWKLGEGVTEQIIGRWFAQGRRAAREGRAGHQGLWRDGRRAERARPVGAAHPPGLRGRACGGCRPTTSTCTRCTTSTATRPGRRSGRRWSCWCSRARCSTSAAATSPAGTSPRRRSRGRARHFLGLVSEQSRYNLLERTVELEVLPACARVWPGPHPVEPACRRGAGRGALEKGEGAAEVRRGAGADRKHQEKLRRYQVFCAELGEQPADVALAWLLHNPVVTAPIIGPRTREQLDGGCARWRSSWTPPP